MRNWLKKYDIITKALSLLAALVLWMYVMGVENPARTLEYSGIHVQLVGVEKLLNAYNLSIIDGDNSTVTMKITDKSDQMAKLVSTQIKASADLTKYITAPGKYSIPYDVVLPVSTMKIEKKYPSTIEIVVDKIVTKFVPVEVNLNGSPSQGFIYEEPVASLNYVTIQGPEKEVNQIVSARVPVSADKLTESLKSNYEYTLVNSSGDEVRSENISRKISMITVTLSVLKIKEVPLEVSLQASDTVDSSLAKVTISPEKVQICGSAKKVDAISSINLGNIDLAESKDGASLDFFIKTPQGIKLIDGQPTTAKVNLKVDGVGSQQFTVNTIEIVDTSTEEQKPKLELKTKSLEVTLKGKNSVLAGLTVSNIQAVLTVDSSKLTEGEHTLPVSVTVPLRPDVTVSEDYTAVLEVSKS